MSIFEITKITEHSILYKMQFYMFKIQILLITILRRVDIIFRINNVYGVSHLSTYLKTLIRSRNVGLGNIIKITGTDYSMVFKFYCDV